MTDSERLAKIILILEDVLSGRIDANSALNGWPDIDAETNATVKAVWHDLVHFIDDSDIYSRDSTYKTYQRDLIMVGLEKLKAEIKTD